MISLFLPAPLAALLTALGLAANVIFWGLLINAIALLKLIPLAETRAACTKLIFWMAVNWQGFNKIIFRLLHPVSWQIDDRTKLDPNKSYLIIANHQSWVDILLLFDFFHLRLPFLRFFLKQELMYVPFVGIGCWAMDFPFMRRHGRKALKKNPDLRGQDMETTRRACQIYRNQPVGLVNFLEGTRFSETKRVAKKSPYRHLLRPKATGLSLALNAMGDQFGGIIDVTIAYRPTTKKLLWSWLSGEQDQLDIHVDQLPIPPEMIKGDYEADAEFRKRFQTWINGIWTRKDARLERMLNSPPISSSRTAQYY